MVSLSHSLLAWRSHSLTNACLMVSQFACVMASRTHGLIVSWSHSLLVFCFMETQFACFIISWSHSLLFSYSHCIKCCLSHDLNVLVYPGLSFNYLHHSLINLVTQWSFVKISSEHLHSQTVRDRKLPPPVMRYVSFVMCHVSHVTCGLHMSHVMFFLLFFFYKVVKLAGEGLLSTG